MNEFPYFTRLIEMSHRRPIEVSGISNDESEIETVATTANESEIETVATTANESDILQKNSSLDSQPNIKSNDSNDEISPLNASPRLSNVLRSEDQSETSSRKWKKQLAPVISSNQDMMKSQTKEVEPTFSTPKRRVVTPPSPSSSSQPPNTRGWEDSIEVNLKQDNSSEPEIKISTSPTLKDKKKIKVKEDIQNKGFLQNLLDNSSFINDNIREDIDRHIHSKFDHVSDFQDQVNDSHSSSKNTSKNLTNDNVSVSIGTIMIKITNADKENDRTPTQINFLKSDKKSTPSLRRYYVKLR